MATEQTASIVTLHQPARAKTPAERQKAYRDRLKAKRAVVEILPPVAEKPVLSDLVAPAPKPPAPSNGTGKINTVALPRPDASTVLKGTALGLAIVGICMNGHFAHGLGSTGTAGWLFAAIGVAADLVALAIPTCAARRWQAHQRGSALAGWLVWSATLLFAIIASIGFASTSISDVTLSRASRVTPAVTVAQASLADATSARDRECKGGTGKFCREREATVVERQKVLDAAMHSIMQTADPQAEAVARIVAWLTGGSVRPTADDLVMLRLILLALLPQLGGVLLMIGRK
jgi:hypothetical protein